MCKLQIVQTNGISQEHVFIATFAPCTYEIFRRHLMRSSSFEIVILWDRHLMRSSCEIEIIFWVCMSQNEMRMHHVYLHIQSVCLDLFLLFLLLLHTCRPAGTLIQVFFLFQRGIPLHKSYRRRNNFREIQCLKRAFSAFSRSFSTFFASTNSPGFNPRASPFSMAALHREFDSPNFKLLLCSFVAQLWPHQSGEIVEILIVSNCTYSC